MEVAVKQLSNVEIGIIIEHNFEKYLESVDRILQHLKCTRCGRCCKMCAATLSVEDLSRLSDKFGMKMDNFVKRYCLTKWGGRIGIFLNSPCPFYSKDDGCAIYEWRPETCTKYPFSMNGLWLNAVDKCPLATKISEWLVKAGKKYSKMSKQERDCFLHESLIKTDMDKAIAKLEEQIFKNVTHAEMRKAISRNFKALNPVDKKSPALEKCLATTLLVITLAADMLDSFH
jgi:Fe-S-cluster containining protein